MLGFFLSPPVVQFMKRGAIAIGIFAGLGFAALVLFIATRDLAEIERSVIVRIEAEFGANLTIAKSRHVYWPLPRVVIEGAQLNAPQDKLSFTAPRMVIGLDVLDLLDGEIEGIALTLQDAHISVHTGSLDAQVRSPRHIMQALGQFAALFEGRKSLNRLRIILTNARLTLIGGAGGQENLVLAPLDARFRYMQRTGRIDVFARRQSDIRPLEFTFSLPTLPLLIKPAGAPVSFAISGYGSRATLNGRMRADPDLSFIGDASAALHPALAAAFGISEGGSWLNGTEVTHLSSTLSLDPRGIGLESLRIAQSGKTLAGIAALRENGGRWSLSSTLAGDLVDGTAAQRALSRLRQGDGAWSRMPLDLNPAPQIDLDLRLSTKTFRIGGIELNDAALSIFTRMGRAEFSIAEGGFGQGTVKARVTLLQRPEGHDLRLLLSGEKLEAGLFLERAFGFSRLSGKGSFLVQAESNGLSVADYIHNLAGSSAFDIRDGEILGIDLEKLAARSAVQPPQAALFSAIGGRTPFELLNTSFTILNGKIEPSGSRFVSANVESQLDGMVDLPSARHELAIILKRRRAIVGSESEFFAFRIEGPLLSPLIRPDLSLLPNRS